MNGSYSTLFVVLGAVGLLAGCGSSNTEKDFLCQAQEGQPCTSISAIDNGFMNVAPPLGSVPRDVYSAGKFGSPLSLLSSDYPRVSRTMDGTLWVSPAAAGR